MGRPPLKRMEKTRVGTVAALPEKVVKSAGRVLQILELFDDMQRDLSIVEVAETLGCPQSSANVLMKSLVALGYLERTAIRTFVPTGRVALLGSWSAPPLASFDRIRAVMEDLAASTGEFVTLTIRIGAEVKIIHVIQAQDASRWHLTLGAHRPLLRAATGRAVLSTYSDAEIAKIVRRINASTDEAGRAPLAEVMDSITQLRANGFLTSIDAITKGGGTVCAPIVIQDRQPLVLGIASIKSVIVAREAEFAALLRDGIRIIQDGFAVAASTERTRRLRATNAAQGLALAG